MANQNPSHDAPTPDYHNEPPFDIHHHPFEQQPEDIDQDSDGISPEELPEFTTVNLEEIRKDLECPICLGIIRKTRTVMECLHRFCGECIEEAMRKGNNECPVCRTHCASRRSLRDDPNYDALIAVLYPDIDKYEAAELEFGEEEKSQNEKIQASISETSRRQSEAKGRKRTKPKRNKREGQTQFVADAPISHAALVANSPFAPAEVITDSPISPAELVPDAPAVPAELVADVPISSPRLGADAPISPAELVANDDHVARSVDLL